MNGPAVGSRSGWKERANDGGRIGSGGGCQLAADGSELTGGLRLSLCVSAGYGGQLMGVWMGESIDRKEKE